MKPGRTGLHGIAIFAILFLLGCGFVVYAVPGSALAPLDTNPNAATQGNVYFHLVQVNPSSSPGGNATGNAGISINGQSLRVEWYIKGGLPGEQLQGALLVAETGGAPKSSAIGTSQVTSQGTAGSYGYVTLVDGSYLISMLIVDTTSQKPVLTGVPAVTQIQIGSSQTETTTAYGNSLSYRLIPLPVYLHQAAPSSYSFKEGGGLIVVSGNTLQLTTSFLGTPNTSFTNVIQIPNHNLTVGSVTTNSNGGAVFKGNVTLAPGTYTVGLLIFSSNNHTSPVAVSVPRAIQVALPIATTTHTTTASSTTTHSSTSQSSISHSTTATTTTTYRTSESTNRLQFTPIKVSNAPGGYEYGEGEGAYALSGNNLYFSLSFNQQNPNTHYALALSVNGSVRTIGNFTTDSEGQAHLGALASTALGVGTFVLGLTVLDTSTFGHPTPVLASVPPSFTVAVHATTTTSHSTTTTTSPTTTTATSSTSHSIGGNEGHSWIFKLTPAAIASAPSGYRFPSAGKAAVTLSEPHSLLNIELGFQNGNPSTTYNAALVLNGTTTNIGTMTTNKAGNAELHANLQVSPGTYLLGLMVFDVSNIDAFKAQGPVLVMVSSPSTQVATIGTPNSQQQENQGENQGENEGPAVRSSLSSTLTTLTAGGEVQNAIQKAVDNLTIPATVQVTALQSSTDVRDSRFSLSVGQQVGNGLVIAISGDNVTGPRVLLINMSKASPLALYPALNVTLDGMPVVEATSALQVLNPSASDPARYVIIATASSIQLLVSIPHFSLHLVQVAGEIVRVVQTTLAVDGPLLIGSVLVITLAFAAAYAGRKRFFSIL